MRTKTSATMETHAEVDSEVMVHLDSFSETVHHTFDVSKEPTRLDVAPQFVSIPSEHDAPELSQHHPLEQQKMCQVCFLWVHRDLNDILRLCTHISISTTFRFF